MQGKLVFLSPAYLAPIHYYSKLYHYPVAVMEQWANYNKQSYCNRCNIVSANGMMLLSIPVENSFSEKTFLCDVRISQHGSWQKQHWRAMESAYRSSPFFDYYEDEFVSFFEQKQNFLLDFNLRLQGWVMEQLGLSRDIRLTETYMCSFGADEVDFRERIHPKRAFEEDETFFAKPYYQVFQLKYGFLPNMSIIDLLFNMGPEARLVLRESFVNKI